jgi:hypothetical protein
MTLQKAVAIAVIGIVLTLQGRQLWYPGEPQHDRYWPFVNWPMYSISVHAPKQFSRQSLRVLACPAGAEVAEVTHEDAHVETFVFYQMLRAATDSGPSGEAMTDTLESLVKRKWPHPACGIQLWQQTFHIGRQGLERADVPWVLVWERRPEAGASWSPEPASRKDP